MTKNKIPKITEKRHYQRLECELPVRLEVDGKALNATSQNVSCGGMFLPWNEDKTFEGKKELIAFINLPDRAETIRLPAKINRLEKDLENKLKGIALEFQGLYDTNRLELDRYVKWKLLN